ncbi:MAG: hypothetical protein AAGG69_14365 [Pseudomonadota bacterium]
MRTIIALAGALIAFTTVSFANASEFDTCRQDLSPEAQSILAKVTDNLQEGGNPERVIRTTVRGMVRAGELEMSTAREHTMSAVECLRMLEG